MKRLEFGLQPPPRTRTAWGARAIYRIDRATGDGVFEILWDRQSAIGKPDGRKALENWLNTSGMEQLRELVRAEGMPTGDGSMMTYEDADAGYTIRASTLCSYGYLYMVAFPTPGRAKVKRCHHKNETQIAFRVHRCNACGRERVRE